jgi:hypothetical protein
MEKGLLFHSSRTHACEKGKKMLRRFLVWALARLTPGHPLGFGGPYRDERYSTAARNEREFETPPHWAHGWSTIVLIIFACVVLIRSIGTSSTNDARNICPAQQTNTLPRTKAPMESMTMWVSEAPDSTFWVRVFALDQQNDCREIVVRECPGLDGQQVVTLPSFATVRPATDESRTDK